MQRRSVSVMTHTSDLHAPRGAPLTTVLPRSTSTEHSAMRPPAHVSASRPLEATSLGLRVIDVQLVFGERSAMVGAHVMVGHATDTKAHACALPGLVQGSGLGPIAPSVQNTILEWTAHSATSKSVI